MLTIVNSMLNQEASFWYVMLGMHRAFKIALVGLGNIMSHVYQVMVGRI